MADALDLAPQHSKAIAALLRTDEAPDGGADYENHVAALISTFENLGKQLVAKKASVDQLEGQNKKDFNQLMKTKTEIPFCNLLIPIVLVVLGRDAIANSWPCCACELPGAKSRRTLAGILGLGSGS